MSKTDDVIVANDNDTVVMFSLAGKCTKVVDFSLQGQGQGQDQGHRGSSGSRLRTIDVTVEGYIIGAIDGASQDGGLSIKPAPDVIRTNHNSSAENR